jgi:hypothetical protein
MNEMRGAGDRELVEELEGAVAEVESVLGESWFHEMASPDKVDHLAGLALLLEQG